ncbi:MAG: hypothetical protein HGGPFJEG_01167 [Ignavibacteria bacterium]|nr:hypothetical protein [Ignavibacteria bacterium]
MSKDPMKDLHRLLEKQNFNNEEEINEFLNSMKMKSFPELGDDELSNEEKAQDLADEAYYLPPKEAFKNISRAFELDPECISAYEYLGTAANDPEEALKHFEKGISIGRNKFGGNFLKEHKGRFWGIYETRPFMKILEKYAECLYILRRKKECISIFEEMIELNPNDNQGVRDYLMLYLIEVDDFDKFDHYFKIYAEDVTAFYNFNKALCAFKREGESNNSNECLKSAIKNNKFVLPLLISSKQQTEILYSYTIGSKEEAKFYAYYAQLIWQRTPGAIKWLMKFRHFA